MIAAAAPGALADRAIRINHTGPDAALAPVLNTLTCLGSALRALGGSTDVAGAVGAAEDWSLAASPCAHVRTMKDSSERVLVSRARQP
jgi:aspartate aminotransferase-like enzyme